MAGRQRVGEAVSHQTHRISGALWDMLEVQQFLFFNISNKNKTNIKRCSFCCFCGGRRFVECDVESVETISPHLPTQCKEC